jgi:diguanylate cyclase (GGDEF)-like protein
MGGQSRLSSVNRSVFRNLFVSMIAFGLLVGVLFPPFAQVVLDCDRALSMSFFALCMAAGLLVGVVNYLLFDRVVSRDLARVVRGMHSVLEHVATAESVGEDCAEGCTLEVTSNDAIGDIECAFNDMTAAIARRLRLEIGTRALNGRLSSTVDLDGVSKIILSSLCQVCGAGAALLYGDTGDRFDLLAHHGIDANDGLPRHLDEHYGPVSRALESGEIVRLSPAIDGLEWIAMSTPLGTLRPRHLIVVPLIAEQRPAGILFIACPNDSLDPDKTELLDSLRNRAAPYLQNAILHRKITDLAALDDLTRILNRRFGLRRLQEEFSRAVRHGVPVSVLLLDVDHFKQFNDSFGHDAGDQVLKAVAAAVEDNLRAGDVICRYGGEEFMVVAPGTGLRDGAAVAERLRRLIEATAIRWGSRELRVTASVGVATWPMARVSVCEELVSAADSALYAAKDAGRNRVAALMDGRPIGYDALQNATALFEEAI